VGLASGAPALLKSLRPRPLVTLLAGHGQAGRGGRTAAGRSASIIVRAQHARPLRRSLAHSFAAAQLTIDALRSEPAPATAPRTTPVQSGKCQFCARRSVIDAAAATAAAPCRWSRSFLHWSGIAGAMRCRNEDIGVSPSCPRQYLPMLMPAASRFLARSGLPSSCS
jgi:hypothetical protein